MGLLEKLFGKGTHHVASKEVAKERLRVVLIHDRSDVSPELLETLRQEIIAVISEHVIIDETEDISVYPPIQHYEQRLISVGFHEVELR